MTSLTIVRGVSGSGKSTWANNQLATVVSRDLIRLALYGTESMADEERVTAVEDADVRALLRRGKDVIVDDTNINWQYVMRLAKIGWSEGADVSVKVFDASLDKCLKNNDHRAMMGGRDVPHQIIKNQYERFQHNKNKTLPVVKHPEPYFGSPGRPEAFLCDLDGTLADFHKTRGPYDINVEDDEPIEVIIRIVNALYKGGYDVVFMSGRKEAARGGTQAWLDAWTEVKSYELFMRADDDNRSDNLIKADLFDEYVRDYYDVKFVLDDRNQVVDMWRRMGLTCLQVAEGNF